MRTIAVLAGGRSSRFGPNKALTLFARKPLLVHVLDRLRHVGNEFLVSVGPHHEVEDYRKVLPGDVKIVRDVVDVEGPLTGLVSVLTECKSPYCFIAACDLPFIEPRVVELLFERASHSIAAVPKWNDGRLEPTHAVYFRDTCKRAGSEVLNSSRRSINDMIRALTGVTYVGVESEIASIDTDLRTFRNLNTPDDLVAAEKETAQS